MADDNATEPKAYSLPDGKPIPFPDIKITVAAGTYSYDEYMAFLHAAEGKAPPSDITKARAAKAKQRRRSQPPGLFLFLRGRPVYSDEVYAVRITVPAGTYSYREFYDFYFNALDSKEGA